MKKHLQHIALASAVIVGLSACDMKKQLTEMHDSTGEMNDTTKKMNTSMEGMHGTMQGMNKTMDGMNGTMLGMNKTMDGMNGTMQGMNGTMLGMNKTMLGMDGTMQGMNKTMNGMDGTMQGMNKNMDGMSETMQAMYKMTNELYDSARQGDASTQRRAAFQELWRASSLGLKLTEAVKYFISFEFQLFNGMGKDAHLEKRTELASEAAAEFFKTIKECISGNPFTKALAQQEKGTEENKDACFNAVSVALSRANRKQQEYLYERKNEGVEKISMFSIIVDSLAKKQDVNSGKIKLEDLNGYEKEVLNNEAVAIRLLQARQTTLSAILFAELSHIQSFSLIEKARTHIDDKALAGMGSLLNQKWSIKISELNIVQLATYQDMINAVLQTHQILKKMSVQPHLDKDLDVFYGNATIVDATDTKDATLKDAQVKFKKNIETFIKVMH